ncbi:hypothetical protein MHBO_001620, partial [Bonamia ostreae]
KIDSIVHKYRNGNSFYCFSIVKDFLQQIANSEQPFLRSSFSSAISDLCKLEHNIETKNGDFEEIISKTRSHFNSSLKNQLAVNLLEKLSFENYKHDKNGEFAKICKNLSKLPKEKYSETVLKSRKIYLELKFNLDKVSKLRIEFLENQTGYRFNGDVAIENGDIKQKFGQFLRQFEYFLISEKCPIFAETKNILVLNAIKSDDEANFEKFQKIIENVFKAKNDKMKRLSLKKIIIKYGTSQICYKNVTGFKWERQKELHKQNNNEPKLENNVDFAKIKNGPGNKRFYSKSVLKNGKNDQIDIATKRKMAEKLKTTFYKDFLTLFKTAMSDFSDLKSKSDFGYEEYFLSADKKEMIASSKHCRKEILTNCGVKVFKLRFGFSSKNITAMLIVNDLTHKYGSFSLDESDLFCLASKKSRTEKLPLIYISANSGAKIGVADEIWNKMRVCAKEMYLYLYKEDAENMKNHIEGTIVHNKEENKAVFKLSAIIGKEKGIGVENLSASGAIASEMAQAYEETFTLSYVTGRSVGIGAYLVRLGRRVIQNKNAAILLTGFNALNKILGDNIYTSNLQIGGPKIMSPCGITHLVVEDDMKGIFEIVRWLNYLPHKSDLFKNDFITTKNSKIDEFKSYTPFEVIETIFDPSSFKEYLGDWAKSVIIGRARLGGIPVGVITSEMQKSNKIVPADPAVNESRETVISRAGQVWYPESSQKTAAALRDFTRENLPIFVLANWRGFSGGMRDMFDEVLKTGAEIVCALKECKKPVFVYLSPKAELRGGAWVVLDSKINPSVIETYSSKSARSGILEAEGTLDVKIKELRIENLARRLDAVLSSKETRCDQEKIRKREKQIFPIYRKAAVEFVDLHDRPERMLKVGVVRKIVPFGEARSFFRKRLCFKLKEMEMVDKIKILENISFEEAVEVFRSYLKNKKICFEVDTKCFEKMEEDFESFLAKREEKQLLLKIEKSVYLDKKTKNDLEIILKQNCN